MFTYLRNYVRIHKCDNESPTLIFLSTSMRSQERAIPIVALKLRSVHYAPNEYSSSTFFPSEDLEVFIHIFRSML